MSGWAPLPIHIIDLDDLVTEPAYAISNDRMFNSESWLSGGNDVLSIEQIPGMVLVGSREGMWALEGDGGGVGYDRSSSEDEWPDF